MSNNKTRLFELYRYLYRNSDAQHSVTTQELISVVKEQEGKYSRNTVASDMNALISKGYDIVKIVSSGNSYYLGTREFEMQEIKLLIDAVSASKFITENQSRQLIRKLKQFASRYQAQQLTRNLYSSEIKPASSAAIYCIDDINKAITRHRKIQFQYYDYAPDKTQHPRHDGKMYINSPFCLVWDHDRYYMVGWSDEHEKIVQFRADRMKNVEILSERAHSRKGFKIAEYVRENFQMYEGTAIPVRLRCRNDLMNALIDQFGEKVPVQPNDDGTFIADVVVGDSPTFYGWVFQFMGGIRILGPQDVVLRYQQMLRQQINDNP